MIFQHTLDAVLNGTKTETRRRVKPEHTPIRFTPYSPIVGIKTHRRWLYHIDHLYAVQPGRNRKAVAQIRILDIWREDVRGISIGSVAEEGFSSVSEFLMTWRDDYSLMRRGSAEIPLR